MLLGDFCERIGYQFETEAILDCFSRRAAFDGSVHHDAKSVELEILGKDEIVRLLGPAIDNLFDQRPGKFGRPPQCLISKVGVALGHHGALEVSKRWRMKGSTSPELANMLAYVWRRPCNGRNPSGSAAASRVFLRDFFRSTRFLSSRPGKT